jgi:hypothetical protein
MPGRPPNQKPLRALVKAERKAHRKPGIVTAIRGAWHYRKHKREFNKAVERGKRLERIMSTEILEPLDPKPVSKPVAKSRTTQDVATGAAVAGTAGGGTAYGVIKAVRAVKPDALPWTEDMDGNVALVAALVLTPIISRAVAMLRRGTAPA